MIKTPETRKRCTRYVNVGEGPHRCWTDMRALGFIAAGHGTFYSRQLYRLDVGDVFYAYQKGHGYVGHGVVIEAAAMAKDIAIDGRPLLDHDLAEPNFVHARNDPELAEYACRVDWIEAVDVRSAKTYSGIFTSRHVVCRLRHEPSLTYLTTNFAGR